METLVIKPTKTHPYICFDPKTKNYEISGQSFPEDPQEVFDPLFSWIENNINSLDHELQLHLHANYFNSASNRLLLKMFRQFELHARAGKEISIIWYYEDDEIQNDGIIFSRLVNLHFEFIYSTTDEII